MLFCVSALLSHFLHNYDEPSHPSHIRGVGEAAATMAIGMQLLWQPLALCFIHHWKKQWQFPPTHARRQEDRSVTD